MSTHNAWFNQVTQGDSVNAVAKLAGIPQASLNKRLLKGALTMEDFTLISRVYAINPIEGLVSGGFISDSEVQRIQHGATLADATDEEIAGEVWRRLVDGEAGTAITDPITSPRGPSHLSVVPDNVAASKNDGTHNEFEGRD